jgi:hypothetical protein
LYGAMGVGARAQTGWQTVTFHFQRATPAERYTITVNSSGDGSYWEGEPDFEEAKAPAGAVKTIRVRSAMTKLPFSLVGAVGSGNCETHLKNIAQTGEKTLVVEVVNREVAQCTFNWSDKDELNTAVDTFEAIAETMQEGEKLARERRFDRLGLDAEMASLVDEVKAGRAIEVGNIAGVLTSIAEDDRVIGRVRRQAAWLLEGAGVTAKGAGQ